MWGVWEERELEKELERDNQLKSNQILFVTYTRLADVNVSTVYIYEYSIYIYEMSNEMSNVGYVNKVA